MALVMAVRSLRPLAAALDLTAITRDTEMATRATKASKTITAVCITALSLEPVTETVDGHRRSVK